MENSTNNFVAVQNIRSNCLHDHARLNWGNIEITGEFTFII